MAESEIVITERDLAVALHRAWEWQYGECDHGAYAGGVQAGLPYKMCEVMAGRIVDTAGGVAHIAPDSP